MFLEMSRSKEVKNMRFWGNIIYLFVRWIKCFLMNIRMMRFVDSNEENEIFCILLL